MEPPPVHPAIHFDRGTWPEEAAALERAGAEGLFCVGVDLARPAAGLGAIVNARRSGIPVAVSIVYRDPLEALLLQILNTIAAVPSRELRAQQFAGLHEGRVRIHDKTPAELAATPREAINAAKFAIGVADVVLVASTAEHLRLERLIENQIRRWTVLPHTTIHPPASRSAAYTVFAPSIAPADLGGILMMLALRGLNAQVISAGNPDEPISGGTVILPEFWRAMRAHSLASAGYRVVVAKQSGADESFTGVTPFALTDVNSLGDALDALNAGPAPRAKYSNTAATVASVAKDDAPLLHEGPVVSIVMRTAERPELLRRAIASIVAQTYKNLEIVLVDNGALDARSVAQEASCGLPLTYVRPNERASLAQALNLGMRNAGGTYVGYLDDDDILYPDHCARLVSLLERAKADFAYSNCVCEYAKIDLEGRKDVQGMYVYTHWQYRLDELFSSNLTTIHSVIHRRSLFERFGYADETLPVTEDWELWLRMATGGASFVYLDRSTCEYSWRDDARNPNTSTKRRQEFAQAYEMIVDRYRPLVADRAETILVRQQANLTHLRNRAEEIARDPNAASRFDMEDLMYHAAPVEGLLE